MVKKIKVAYFPVGMKFSTPLIFGFSIYLLTINRYNWAAITTLIGIAVLTTAYVTEIDLSNKSYSDYLSVIGLKINNESNHFNKAEIIVITKGRYAQTINTRSQSRQLDWTDYTATLLFDQGELALLTRNSKNELVKELKTFVEFLNVDVEDQTTGQAFLVDMSRI